MTRWKANVLYGFAIFAIIVLFAVFVVSLMTLHFTLWDRGGSALKSGNGALALKYLKPLAWLGDERAQQVIGDIYAYGSEGIRQNDDEAMYWFHRIGFFGGSCPVSEEGADRAAAYELAVASTYACGRDPRVEVADPVESLKWLKRAELDGSKKAASILGKIERSGLQQTNLCLHLLSETGSMGPAH